MAPLTGNYKNGAVRIRMIVVFERILVLMNLCLSCCVCPCASPHFVTRTSSESCDRQSFMNGKWRPFAEGSKFGTVVTMIGLLTSGPVYPTRAVVPSVKYCVDQSNVEKSKSMPPYFLRCNTAARSINHVTHDRVVLLMSMGHSFHCS